jgi:hypothetical protein
MSTAYQSLKQQLYEQKFTKLYNQDIFKHQFFKLWAIFKVKGMLFESGDDERLFVLNARRSIEIVSLSLMLEYIDSFSRTVEQLHDLITSIEA